MMTGTLKRKYNSGILCISSLIYFLAGVITYEKTPYLSLLLFIVTIFSILYYNNFKNFNLKTLDWVSGIVLAVYLYYFFGIYFNTYIFVFLVVLVVFRIFDHLLFKTKRYGVFSYTHSVWHLLSGIVIILLFIFNKV